jgi:hypothetical protein
MIRRIAFVIALLAALFASFCVSSSAEASSLTSGSTWSAPVATGGDAITALDCPTDKLCFGTDYAGNEISSKNAGESWSVSSNNISKTDGFSAISCPSKSLCVGMGDGVGDEGFVIVNTHPALASSWKSFDIDRSANLTSISCANTSFCLAADADGLVFTTTRPTGGRSGWKSWKVDTGNQITAVSCASPSACILVDEEGNVFTSTHPSTGVWKQQVVDFPPWAADSCPPGSQTCFAVGAGGEDAAVSMNFGGFVDTTGDPYDASAISCPSSHLCVAGDVMGNALTSATPNMSSAYHSQSIDPGNSITVVTCASASFCVAADNLGNVIIRTG